MNIWKFLHKPVLFILTILAFNQNTFANIVKVEAKQFKNQTVFVFYHDRATALSANYLGGHATIRSTKPIELQLINQSTIKSLTNKVQLSSDKHTISFKTTKPYRFLGVINGESLVAINLQTPLSEADVLAEKQKKAEIEKAKQKELEEQRKRELEQKIAKEKLAAEQQATSVASNEPKTTATVKEDIKATDTAPTPQVSTPAVEPAHKTQKIPKVDTEINHIVVKKSAANAYLMFPFSEANVGAAVFQRGDDLWIVFDRHKNFALDNNTIGSWQQYDDPNNTIIRLKLKDKLTANVSKTQNNWVVSLTNKPSTLKRELVAENTSPATLAFKDVMASDKMLKINDKDIGDTLVIVPLADDAFGVKQDKTTVDYHILQSEQGIVIALLSEEVKVDYNKDEQRLDIISLYALPHTTTSAPAAGLVSPKSSGVTSILPVDRNIWPVSAFNDTKLNLFAAIANAENDKNKHQALLDLAKFFFAHELYNEAAGTFQQLRSYSLTPEYGLMKALSLSFTGRALDARANFRELKNTIHEPSIIAEIDLWNNYNEAVLENNAPSLGEAFPLFQKNYPDELYWRLTLTQLNLLLLSKNTTEFDAIMAKIRKTQDPSLTNEINYYQATYYFKHNQYNLAVRLLEAIKRDATSGRDFVRAELDLIKIAVTQNRITWEEVINRLETARYAWHGDQLEMQLLLALAEAYKKQDDVVGAIRAYQYILNAFENQTQNFYLSNQIIDLYQRIFSPDSNKNLKLDDFTVIALFYEFKKFTPIGKEGDRIVLEVARRMLNLDLLEMASELLQHQVTFRLQGDERSITANHLALVFLMDKKPESAIKILDDTDRNNTSFEGQQQRNYLRAQALIDLNKYDEALNFIQNDDSADAHAIANEIYFRNNNWQTFISNVEPRIKKLLADGDVIKDRDGQDAMRLAICYSLLNQNKELDYLASHLITDNEELKKIIAFLGSTNDPINPHDLDKSLNIDNMKTFIDNYKQNLFKSE